MIKIVLLVVYHGTEYDTGASLLEDIKNLKYKNINIFDYCIHLGHGSQTIYGNKKIDIHIRENDFLKINSSK